MKNENHDLSLRRAIESDLEVFFVNQLDEEAGYMAAFIARDPTDKKAYMDKWIGLLKDDTLSIYTILLGGEIAGSISSYDRDGKPQITYWIGKTYWGKGVATKALNEFLKIFTVRPLYGSAAIDNIASRKVMQKCGFLIIGYERAFANARNGPIEEVSFKLD